jgi:hypothetical protein
VSPGAAFGARRSALARVFLDVNRDGSVADDVMGFVAKMFKQ